MSSESLPRVVRDMLDLGHVTMTRALLVRTAVRRRRDGLPSSSDGEADLAVAAALDEATEECQEIVRQVQAGAADRDFATLADQVRVFAALLRRAADVLDQAAALDEGE